jgi:hypothetical protein
MCVYVSRMGEMRNAHKILVKIYQGKNHLRDLGVDGKIMLNAS